MTISQPVKPDGALISIDPAIWPTPKTHHIDNPSLIQSVALEPLSSSHTDALYSSLGGAKNAHTWQYIAAGPYYDPEMFNDFMKMLLESTGDVCFAILKNDASVSFSNTDRNLRGTPVGIISLGPIVPVHRSLEIGIMLSPLLQRTTVATEATYILLKHCFDDLGYRRVEWKTDNLNEASKRAAVRLGFTFEAMFRQHMIVKGKSRDSAWYSLTDQDWKGDEKSALKDWLKESNFDKSGQQLRKLKNFRKEA